jgi:hypothetical protein
MEIVEEKQVVEKFKEIEQANLNSEWAEPVYLDEKGVLQPFEPEHYLAVHNRGLYIEGDSLYGLDYPLQLDFRAGFKLKDNVLKFKGEDREVSLGADGKTLTLSYVDYYGLYIVETWQKTSFDSKIVDLLRRYGINLTELAGDWQLIRASSDAYGTEYHLDFPYTIDDKLTLTKAELERAQHADQSIEMKTDGRQKKYFVHYEDGELHLVPASWFDHEAWLERGYETAFHLRFEKMEIDKRH